MAIALFNNETEKIYFYNLLAARKLKDQRKEREGYEKEIEKALNSCGKILKDHGARCNFIAEIDKIERAMEPKGILPPSATSEESDYAEQISALTTELTDLLKKIPREISEDLEFFSKQIIDRRTRREETLDKEKELIELYPEADKADLNQIFVTLKHIFDNIRFYTGEKEDLEPVLETAKDDETIDLETNRQKVIGIKKASRSLLENAGLADSKDYSEELAKPITKTNAGLFGIVDDVFSEVNSQPLTPKPVSVIKEPLKDESIKVPQIKPEEAKIATPAIEPVSEISEAELNMPVDVKEEAVKVSEKEPQEIKAETPVFEPISEVSEAELNKPVAEVNETPLVEDAPTVIEPELNQVVKAEAPKEEDSITFEMPEDFTLSDLAMALCEDENGWLDIYDTNKELFDKIVQEKNNGSSQDIENNKELFAGLTIKVPTVFNKGNDSKKAFTKAA